jgi:hypothetical protein
MLVAHRKFEWYCGFCKGKKNGPAASPNATEPYAFHFAPVANSTKAKATG